MYPPDLATRAFKAANDLTARWVESIPLGHTVVSGACVWPLLALLQSGATGRALDQLTAATGVAPDVALTSGLGVMQLIQTIPDAGAALGLWVRDGVTLEASWASRMPEGTVRALPLPLGEATRQLDEWAAHNTGGLIKELPIAITDRTLLVLAAAIFTKLRWMQSYDSAQVRFNGEKIWGLSATEHDLTRFAIIDWRGESVGRFVSRGEGHVDVHLLAGDEGIPGCVVVRAGIEALTGKATVRSADEIEEHDSAGCLRVKTTSGEAPVGIVQVPPFEITARHDLADTPDVFGIRTALDPRHAHFPGIAERLAIDQAGQSACARFHRLGFDAAALVTIGFGLGIDDIELRTVKVIEMLFDRPFGFLAVHRPTGLVLFAGWVTNPADAEEP